MNHLEVIAKLTSRRTPEATTSTELVSKSESASAFASLCSQLAVNSRRFLARKHYDHT